jgi:hypothetical protein
MKGLIKYTVKRKGTERKKQPSKACINKPVLGCFKGLKREKVNLIC